VPPSTITAVIDDGRGDVGPRRDRLGLLFLRDLALFDDRHRLERLGLLALVPLDDGLGLGRRREGGRRHGHQQHEQGGGVDRDGGRDGGDAADVDAGIGTVG